MKQVGGLPVSTAAKKDNEYDTVRELFCFKFLRWLDPEHIRNRNILPAVIAKNGDASATTNKQKRQTYHEAFRVRVRVIPDSQVVRLVQQYSTAQHSTATATVAVCGTNHIPGRCPSREHWYHHTSWQAETRAQMRQQEFPLGNRPCTAAVLTNV